MRGLAGILVFLLTACAAPVSKPDALDRAALETRLSHLVTTSDKQIFLSDPGKDWLIGLDPKAGLTFARLTGEGVGYVLILQVDLPGNRLVVLPLHEGETPLDALDDEQRRRELLASLDQSTAGRPLPAGAKSFDLGHLLRTGSLDLPVPQPKQIFAVAANYPSHISHDLSYDVDAEDISLLERARPRVFLKFPPIPPPGQSLPVPEGYTKVQGPFATVVPPKKVVLPKGPAEVEGHLDYEVEIAAVVGSRLTWDQVQLMSDAELSGKISGYLLFSDAKVRDPQVMNRVVKVMNDVEPLPENSYLIGDRALDATLGIWDEETCQWWSYAASWGRYASGGPVFVAAPGDGSFPPRLMLSGRSYSSEEKRGIIPPPEVAADLFYLRQVAVTGHNYGISDRLLWTLPTIVRSILDPEGNALAFHDKSPVIEAGDLIAMGTPGGTVVTGKPWWLLPLVDDLLFWKDAGDYYRQFFSGFRGYYLHPGDRMLLWADGLGYQSLEIGTEQGMKEF